MKRKTTTTKRRKRAHSLSEAPRKRRATRRRSFLGDLTNPTIAANSAKSTLMAAAGGLGAMVVDKTVIPAKWGKTGKISAGLIGGFLLNNFGIGTIGHGFTGGMFALAFPNGLLADNMEETEFADSDVLSDSPLYLDEAGTPLILDEDGQGNEFFRPMTENEMLHAEY